MPLSWHDAMNLHADKANDAFGEPLTVLPMKTLPNKTPVRDPDRASFKVTGQYLAEAHNGLTHTDDGSKRPYGIVASREPWAILAKADLPYSLQQGDIIRRDRTGETFEVKQAVPYSVGQIRYRLFQMGTPDFLN